MMSSVPGREATAMDDLDTIAARFEEDVARIEIWVNADESTDYVTVDGRQVPSVSKVIANVQDMIAPDVATIMQGATDATQAAGAAQASAASASQDAQHAGASADLVEGYAVTVAADAVAANDSADRAEAAYAGASSARDAAVDAQANVQQNADRASTAASNAAASEKAADGSATAAAASEHQTGLDVQTSSQYAGQAAASAVTAGGSETRAGQSATAAAGSAAASAQSALDSAAHAAAIDPAAFVKKTGDTMTGALIMRGANVMFQNSAAVGYGYLGSYGAAGAAGSASGMGFVDSTLAWWNFQVDNSGNTYTRGSATISGGLRVDGGRIQVRNGQSWGEIGMYSANGTVMFLRGRGTEGGGMQWVNNDYNQIVGDMDNGGNLRLLGSLSTGYGNATLGPDGNIVGGLFPNGIHAWVGQSVSDMGAGKADRYAWCVYATNTVEAGSVDTAGAGGQVNPGSPYVVVGMLMTWTTMHVYVNILRNN
jgi:hypothetical protein